MMLKRRIHLELRNSGTQEEAHGDARRENLLATDETPINGFDVYLCSIRGFEFFFLSS